MNGLNYETLVGAALTLIGVLLIVVVVMATKGPWRVHNPRPFPVRVMDLNRPPSDLEKNPN